MRTLGIDPGIGRTGWGIIDVEKGKATAVCYGCIETSPKKNATERLKEIYEEVEKIIKKYKPDVMAIEDLFFNTNAKTAFLVGQARGVILLCGCQKNLKNYIYTPLQVKTAVAGYGRADKQQVGRMVKSLLSLKEIPKPDDTSDALAIALTCAFSRK